MRIAVAGGTGVVGRHTVEAAQAAGHEVVVLSRSAGADVITGAGLGAALQGAADGDVALGWVDEERADDAGALDEVSRAEAVQGLGAAVAHDKVSFFDVRVEQFEGVRAGCL